MIKAAIRAEEAGDHAAIHAVTKAAFEGKAFSDGSEPELVNRLRKDGDLTLSLVALHEGELVGHIAFSPVTISGGAANWYGLGPVSVAPALQHQGIGGQLIRAGIAEMKQMGARGIVLLGSNEYYPRFGFEHRPDIRYPGPPPEYFQCLLIAGNWPTGTVKYAPAFG